MKEKVSRLLYVQKFHGVDLVLQELYRFNVLTCAHLLVTGLFLKYVFGHFYGY